jgi:hypothetical protein
MANGFFKFSKNRRRESALRLAQDKQSGVRWNVADGVQIDRFDFWPLSEAKFFPLAFDGVDCSSEELAVTSSSTPDAVQYPMRPFSFLYIGFATKVALSHKGKRRANLVRAKARGWEQSCCRRTLPIGVAGGAMMRGSDPHLASP